MNDQLFIRISSDERSLQWGIVSSAETVEDNNDFVERGDLLLEDVETLAETLVTEGSEQTIVLMLPAHRVKCFNIDAPTKNRKHLEKAVPFQLEDQVLQSVDNQHFALGGFDSQDRLAVNVIDKEYFRELLELFKDVGIEPDHVISEAACVPHYKDAWSAVIGEQVLVRQEVNNFWSAEQFLVKELLQLEMQTDELSITQAIRVYSEAENSFELESVAGLATQKELVDDVFYFLSQNYDAGVVNLLQQEFSSQKKTQRNYGVWKLPTIAASILAGLGLVYLISHIVYMNTKLSDLKEQTLTQTKTLYPSLPLSTAIAQVNNSYRNIGGDDGSGASLILLMDKSVNAMSTKSINFSQMEYIASRGQLNMDVSADSYETLTQSQRNLESSGLEVDMRNASENGGVWTARVTVGVKQ